jgi:hypothetical protein
MAFKLSRLIHSTYGNIRECATSHCDEVLSPTLSVVSRKHRRACVGDLYVGAALVQLEPTVPDRAQKTGLISPRVCL